MTDLSRRSFGKKTLLLSCLTALGTPTVAAATTGKARTASDFLDKIPNDAFLQRDDISYAIKSLYQSYNCTSPYPHKFNEVLTKWQLRSLQFAMDNGIEKKHVQHYIITMMPLLKRMKALVEKDGDDKGLYSMFEGTSCGYQLFERIDVEPGQRTFPCPYNFLLTQCKKYLGTFTINWEDVCNKWCTPLWKGFAKEIGIDIVVAPGETCSVSLADREQSAEKGA